MTQSDRPRRKQNFQNIAWFWDLQKRDLLDLEPPYQRRSVWNQGYKDYFIDTILLGYPAPAIFLYEDIRPDGSVSYHVVDGKQRLMTIFEFATNSFPIYDKAERTALRGSYFSDLDDDSKREFWSYQFSVEYLPTKEESIINNVFDRINRNTARLTPQELRHARFGGEFITAAEALADWSFGYLSYGFPNIASRSRKQMKDVELVAQLLLLVETGPRGYSTVQLDEAFSERDENWEEKDRVCDDFRHTVRTLKKILDDENGKMLAPSRFRNQADFYSLFGAVTAELAKRKTRNPISQWARRLASFVDILASETKRPKSQDASKYYDAARSASNDTVTRRTRVEIVGKVLRDKLDK